MRYIYSLLLYLLLPWALFRLAWRGLRNRAYWRRWSERFGFVPRLSSPTIWVHAVSVGEVRASTPLIKALLRVYPGHGVLITTMTPTGSDTVHELFGNTVAHCYVPYDLPTAVWRFLNRCQPCLALIMETEFWPNIFHQCHVRNIPLVLANARLSEKSARGYRRFAALTRVTLSKVGAVGAQAIEDAERIRELGAKAVDVTGNIKFELEIPAELQAKAAILRAGFGVRPVWIAASTREGEELIVLQAFKQLRGDFPNLLLILVPRHPERFELVAKLCAQHGFTVQRRSTPLSHIDPATSILLGDTMGELLLFYAASDVAFIGGSLAPLGGQNLLEAAALGVPVVFGPHMFNFREVSRMALERGAGRQVTSTTELAETLAQFLKDTDARRVAGEAGRQMVADNRGALTKTLTMVKRIYSV